MTDYGRSVLILGPHLKEVPHRVKTPSYRTLVTTFSCKEFF